MAVIARPLREMGYCFVAIRVTSFLVTADEGTLANWVKRTACLREAGLDIMLDADGLFMTDPWDADAPRLATESETLARETILLRCLELAVQMGCRLLTFSVGSSDAVMARRGEMPIGDRLERDSDRLLCIYLSDVLQDVMGDRRFGEGDLAIDRIVEAISELPFCCPLIVRIEGSGEAGLSIAKEAIDIVNRRQG